MLRDFFRLIHIRTLALREERGQTMAEYAVVLSVVAVAAIAAFTLLGGNVSAVLNWVAGKIVPGS